MKRTPEQLDLARRQWLQALSRDDAVHGSGQTALALGQAHYLCGTYDDALACFIAAKERAPDDPRAYVAVVRLASSLARHDIERDALQEGLERVPGHPLLVLHAALREIPTDLRSARLRLHQCADDPACREFLQALSALTDGTVFPRPLALDPRARARHDSFEWVRAHEPDPSVFSGIPSDVLLRALGAAPENGLTLECGVYFGRSLRLIADRTAGIVHGFDSFQGLPEDWNEHEGAGAYSTLGRLPAVPSNTHLHQGWFDDTLPRFFADQGGPIRLLHVDCDLYSSTRTVLESAGPRLVPGSVIVFDDLLGYPGCEEHELKAFAEYTAVAGIEWKIVAAALLGREIAVQVTSRSA